MAVLKMARSVFAPCPYFRDLHGRKLKGLLVIIPKVVISLLMVSRGIIPFEEHIAAVGTTSNNMLAKRQTLDDRSLSSSKSESEYDDRFSSTPYVPVDSGIGPLFNSPCVQIVLLFVCIK